MTTDGNGGVERLRGAFTGHPSGESGDCPDPGTLWESARGRLDRTTEEALMLHIADCPDCATAWALARKMADGTAEEAGRAVPLAPRRRPAWRNPRVLAAAAMVLLAVGLGGSLLLRNPAPEPVVYREQAGGTVVQADPASLRLPRSACRLRWTGAPEGSRFDIIVTNDDLDILCEAHRLTRPEFLVPEATLPPACGTILWRVTVHTPDGETVISPTFETSIVD